MTVKEKSSGVDQATFRYVLGHFASGVTVVTFQHAGKLYGLTVSSFCSLSLEPPLILVCIGQDIQSHDLLKQTESFAVNILAEDGEWLSRHFASRIDNKFEAVPYHFSHTNAPLLDTALASMECQMYASYPGGDHTIFVGQVVASNVRNDVGPLLYYRSGYHCLR
jgi:flavin reductase (DIM6/NTAB) family NADH-FMN oxidoreductase RutF